MLEVLMERSLSDHDVKEARLGRIKLRWERHATKEEGEFQVYAKMALEKLGLDLSHCVIASVDEEFGEYVTAVQAIYALRLLLGALVESLVLMDRVISIAEQEPTASLYLYPLFDPTLSPRNSVLVAMKPPGGAQRVGPGTR